MEVDWEAVKLSERRWMEEVSEKGEVFTQGLSQTKRGKEKEEKLEVEGMSRDKTILEKILEDYLEREVEPLDREIVNGLPDLTPSELKPIMPSLL